MQITRLKIIDPLLNLKNDTGSSDVFHLLFKRSLWNRIHIISKNGLIIFHITSQNK